MEGRPPKLSLPVQKELLKRAGKAAMGAGFTRSQFLDLAIEIHAQHGGGEPLSMADTTLKKEFARLLPESSHTQSTQNMARVNAALNGCTSITHAVMVLAVLDGIDPSLLFNMDRTSLYLNKEFLHLIRFAEGQKTKATQCSQGPSKVVGKDGESSQKRVSAVDCLGAADGNPLNNKYCVVISDNTLPHGPPERVVVSLFV